ncbi:cytoplasmic protein [Microbulbifer sp. OS29]|uniref:Cytoplasmic protein n=1 Tax=Microbulbifer okhotskensis TaxID=2926617 RepID=A0A9X2J9S4_9GAMM|nr:cytoplasmic protein [Microbulbifer okhotskensis]MCO1336916.1 cytoplasmic protein [Microbulbifer okhotskensis]
MTGLKIDHNKVRREGMRWTILLTLNHARPIGAHEQLILQTVQGVYTDATPAELRRELEYLHERELLKVEKAPSGTWRAGLTRHGVDLAEYTVDCEPGIARPEKYWEG